MPLNRASNPEERTGSAGAAPDDWAGEEEPHAIRYGRTTLPGNTVMGMMFRSVGRRTVEWASSAPICGNTNLGPKCQTKTLFQALLTRGESKENKGLV
ncbi:hypothetical protein GCM10009548_01570 [Streptomyces malaysiensis subsp. malaysiensis]